MCELLALTLTDRLNLWERTEWRSALLASSLVRYLPYQHQLEGAFRAIQDLEEILPAAVGDFAGLAYTAWPWPPHLRSFNITLCVCALAAGGMIKM